MRRRRIIMFFAMIMSVAIIGVGFAAWIITAPTTDEVKDGTITVDTVEMYGWKFEAEWKNDNSTIVFGKPTDLTSLTNPWLTPSTDAPDENLTATLNVKALKMEGSYTGTGLANDNTVAAYVVFELYKITKDADGNVIDETPVTEESVKEYFTINVDKDTLTASELSSTNGVNITIKFKWSTNEAGENPYIYFNTASNNKTYEDAYDFLTGLSTATEGLIFKLKLTTTEPTVNAE